MNRKLNDEQWATVEFELAADDDEMASWLMIRCGASGCEIEAVAHKLIRLKASFNKEMLTSAKIKELQSRLEEYGFAQCLRTWRITDIENQDWLSKWKESFTPFPVGNKLLIRPPWIKEKELSPEVKDGRTVLIIEPGMA